MATPNRAALLTKLHKVLKQHFKPLPNDTRPLMEQLLFAACLENTAYETAEAAYAHLREIYFDWNEVRVSTVLELTEILKLLPHASTAAANVKRILQDIFESTYSFDLEPLKKQNIGAGIQRLEKMQGTSPFIVSYVTQHALAGHSIPLDRAALALLRVSGVIDENEAASGKVTGLERTIPKNKGLEFGGLLHQAAAEFYVNAQAPDVKKTLLAVAPSLKDHWPKRSPKKDYELAEKAKEEAARKEAEEKEAARVEVARLEAQAKRDATIKAEQAKANKLARAEAAKKAAEVELHKPKTKPVPEKQKTKPHEPAPKEARGKESHGKESHGKDSHGKDSHGKESHGKESHGKESRKEAHGKEAHGKSDKRTPAKPAAASKSAGKSSSKPAPPKNKKTAPAAKKKSSTKQLTKRKPR
ncbi:MAG TPA: hypothetical protein VFE24_04360 [Pirellulales bacterium]|jgi:endonuclease III|nr:hypothetical protein [Pirellulales bacterium]